MPESYESIAVFGSAYSFEKQCFPDHMYLSLDEAARMYHENQQIQGIAVCGLAAINDLRRGRIPPRPEAHEMKQYLTEQHDVPGAAIYIDDQSVDTTHNFLNLRNIILQEGWQNIYLPTAAGRAARIRFLGKKICHRLCEFDVKGIECDTSFPGEPRVLGNFACTLRDVEWGDPDFNVVRWRELYTAHFTCEYYTLPEESEPFKNYHPPEIMEEYLIPPEA
ncbi:protein of unknown function DUF218 [candidate division TM7 genomosp. GTL1]|nr:protein of unknown function DUF218 [candidate division TM7 genomosp. GTL1]